VAVVRRGDVVLASLDPTVGVEIRKTRPVVVVSNDHINELSQLAVVVPLTKNTSHLSPSHAVIPKGTAGLSVASKALTEQIKAVDKRRLVRRLGTLPVHLLAQIDRALRTTLAYGDAPSGQRRSHIEALFLDGPARTATLKRQGKI